MDDRISLAILYSPVLPNPRPWPDHSACGRARVTGAISSRIALLRSACVGGRMSLPGRSLRCGTAAGFLGDSATARLPYPGPRPGNLTVVAVSKTAASPVAGPNAARTGRSGPQLAGLGHRPQRLRLPSTTAARRTAGSIARVQAHVKTDCFAFNPSRLAKRLLKGRRYDCGPAQSQLRSSIRQFAAERPAAQHPRRAPHAATISSRPRPVGVIERNRSRGRALRARWRLGLRVHGNEGGRPV